MIFDESTLTKPDSSMRQFHPRCLKIRPGQFPHGLAPVEMAIALPLLMLFMATIIAFGYAASWKIRSEVVARNVAWRDRHPRWANSDARALEWPEPATMNRYAGADLATFADDDILQAPIIVGPIPQVNVDPETLNFSRVRFDAKCHELARIMLDPAAIIWG